MTFLQQEFRFTLFTVQTAGFGLGINVADTNFLVELSQAIQEMLYY